MVAVFLLLIFFVNMWLALSALHAVATGVVRMYGRSYRRDRENHEFWFSIASKAATAIILFLYMASIVNGLSQPPPARASVEDSMRAEEHAPGQARR